MNTYIKTAVAAAALSLGLASAPVFAQTYGYDRGASDLGANGYHEDGTLNVFGAHIDPPGSRRGNRGFSNRGDDLTTGSIAPRGTGGYDQDEGYGEGDSAQGGNAQQQTRPVPQYGQTSGGPGY